MNPAAVPAVLRGRVIDPLLLLLVYRRVPRPQDALRLLDIASETTKLLSLLEPSQHSALVELNAQYYSTLKVRPMLHVALCATGLCRKTCLDMRVR